MIKVRDFSEETKKLYKEAKYGNGSIIELYNILYNNDFEVEEIKQFIKKHFSEYAEKVFNFLSI